MPLSIINNGDSGSSARSKINSAIAALNVFTPRVVYVDATTGNNTTAEIGNPTRPYLTFAAAYAAVRATGLDHAFHLGVGTYVYSPPNNEEVFLNCKFILGCGTNLTTFSINSVRTVVSGDGTNGYTVPSLELHDLSFSVVAVGGGSFATGTGFDYVAGNGGNATLTGSAIITNVDLNGGGGDSEDGGTAEGGVSGSLTIAGGLKVIGPVSLVGGEGSGGAAAGADGELRADNCDLRELSNLQAGIIALGRCSYTISLFTPTSGYDFGGNAAY